MSLAVRPVSEQLAQWGFATVPEVLSPERVDKLVEEIDKAFKNRSSHSNHAMRHFFQMVPAIRQVAEDATVRALVDAVLGPSAFVVRSIF